MVQFGKRCRLLSGEDFSERLRKQNRKKTQRTKHRSRRERKDSNASEAPEASENRSLDPMLKLYYPQAVLHHDYSCTLLHVNIAKRRNEFYVMQIATLGKEILFYTRRGNVGDTGQHNTKILTDIKEAVRIFEETFTTKTKTTWAGRRYYEYCKHSYSLLDIDFKAIDEDTGSTLHPKTKRLIRHICSDELFIEMPLGIVSKKQVQRAIHVLDEVEKAIKKEKSKNVLKNLSSKFFTLIPQEICELYTPYQVKTWREKLSAFIELNIFSDSLQERYDSLECDLTYVNRASEEFRLIKQCASGSRMRLTGVWKVDRKGGRKRFSAHRKIIHRKLLWHGTRVPSVALILKQGLRILSRSGGSFGAGIYFASEFKKSAFFLQTQDFEDEKQVGYMFLVEVALGKTFNATTRNFELKTAPKGYDTLVGRGRTEPDPQQDKILDFDGKRVVFPCGRAVPQEQWAKSDIFKSENLIYRESLARLRYLLRFSQ